MKNTSHLIRRCLGMVMRAAVAGGVTVVAFSLASAPEAASAQYGVSQPTDWERFYHYPYVYYPSNFKPRIQYDSLYYKYPQERRIPVYRADWYNYYPNNRPYHVGHHFYLDVF